MAEYKVSISDAITRLGDTHLGVIKDRAKAKKIPLDKRCSRCGGTGNELFAMYRKCKACGGDGITRHNEGEFDD